MLMENKRDSGSVRVNRNLSHSDPIPVFFLNLTLKKEKFYINIKKYEKKNE